MEDQVPHVAVTHLFAVSYEPSFSGPFQDRFAVQAAPVVLDLYVDAASLVEGPKLHTTGFGLPGSATAFGGRFESVVHGVAHHVNQRIAEAVHHGLVQLGILTRHDEPDRLACLPAEVAHQSGHFLEG